jgi:DNA repair exonuclease SbcCD ATPase subunit
MAIQITKAEHDALPDSLKAKFQASGDAYELIEEDVEGLKKSKAEILQEKKDLQAKLAEADKFRKEHEAAQAKAAEADLEAKGKYEEAIAAKEKAWNERFEAEKAEKESLFADIKRERLTNELVKRGALADRAGYLVGELDAETELYKRTDNGKYDLRKKGGIGDAAEFDVVIEAAKQKTPFFFAAQGASGSGASGSNGNGGGKTDTSSMSAVQKLEQLYSGTK